MDLIIALLVFAAVSAAVAAVIQARSDARYSMQMRLERVAGRISSEWSVQTVSPLRSSRLSNIPWVEKLLQDVSIAKSVDMQLIRSDWSIRVSEFFAMVGVAVCVGFLVAFLFTQNLLIALPVAAVAGALPVLALRRAVSKRRNVMEKQLIEALVMIANALKAGFGLLQALDQVSRQLENPIAKELRQTIRDTQIGSSLEEAITGLGVRVGSYDLEIVVTAILVQRNVGGNLSEILDGVAHMMRERDRIRGEIKTLTSQQRLTGMVIAGLPFGLAALFSVMSPKYMSQLFTTDAGHMMIGGALFLEAIGAFIIKRIISIDV